MSNSNSSSTNITTKIRSSLVLKLNTKMILRLLSAFLSINIFIFLIGFFAICWNAEKGMNEIIEAIEQLPQNTQLNYDNVWKYRIFSEIEKLDGFKFPAIVQEFFPKKNVKWERSIGLSDISNESKLLKKVESVRYSVITTINGDSYQIIYEIGHDLKLLIILFFILLVFELIKIIEEIGKGAKMIRKTLKPLYDLSETTKSLNAEVSGLGTKPQDRHIKDLAGVISSIDANKLDKRISVDSSQDELKDLAFAINDMLNRINDSYQAQVRFVSDASHELRTPISVIQGYVNLLDRWGKNDEKTMQEAIDAIKSETQNMKELVEQLLFLARGDSNTIRLNREDFDACEVVDEIVREAQMIDPAHSFDIDLKGPAYISGDKQLIKQAIRILVDNSIKYTPEGEKIILRVDNGNDSVSITVQDNGIGIAPEDIPRIFDRFYRSDESRARKTGGSGLGLSIAKWIIERHGAYFEVLSRVDIGTRITIVMPSTKLTSTELITE